MAGSSLLDSGPVDSDFLVAAAAFSWAGPDLELKDIGCFAVGSVADVGMWPSGFAGPGLDFLASRKPGCLLVAVGRCRVGSLGLEGQVCGSGFVGRGDRRDRVCVFWRTDLQLGR